MTQEKEPERHRGERLLKIYILESRGYPVPRFAKWFEVPVRMHVIRVAVSAAGISYVVVLTTGYIKALPLCFSHRLILLSVSGNVTAESGTV